MKAIFLKLRQVTTRHFPALFVLAILFMPLQGQAQIFKKIFEGGRERPARHASPNHRIHDSRIEPEAAGGRKPKQEKLQLAKTQRKARYRIDVLVSLYLDDLVKNGKPVYKSHLPDRVMPGLGFYHGIQLAADTLNGLGYQLDIYLHDITDPKQCISVLLNTGGLDSADLIIGAINTQEVKALAELAKKKHINFVSTFSPIDGGITRNLYFNLLQPTLRAHCDAVKDALARLSKPTTNLLVFQRNNVAVDRECFQYLTRDSAFACTRVVVDSLLPKENLRNFLDSNATNYIAIPILDANYARKLLDQLGSSFPTYHFEVYGMPSWKGMKLFEEPGVLPNVAVTFPTAFYYDPTSSVGKSFSDAYNAHYGSRPGLLAYRGYETMIWYAYLLKRYGTVFNDHYNDVGMSPFTRFDMKLAHTADTPLYYENKHLYLYRYQAGNLMVQQ
ncbi:MAG: hypothetical protein JST27_11435 [Bacteroidetes bacterium]|nr:hypothetical protein [Bacteroidota bacterium]